MKIEEYIDRCRRAADLLGHMPGRPADLFVCDAWWCVVFPEPNHRYYQVRAFESELDARCWASNHAFGTEDAPRHIARYSDVDIAWSFDDGILVHIGRKYLLHQDRFVPCTSGLNINHPGLVYTTPEYADWLLEQVGWNRFAQIMNLASVEEAKERKAALDLLRSIRDNGPRATEASEVEAALRALGATRTLEDLKGSFPLPVMYRGREDVMLEDLAICTKVS